MSGPRTRAPGGAVGGLVVGRPLGVPVVVSPSWLVLAAVLTWLLAPGIADQVPSLGRGGSYAVALGFVVLVYLSVLVHELAHTATALRFGLPVRRITLHLLGGVSELDRQPPTPGRSIAVSTAGPAVNLLLALAAYAVVAVAPDDGVVDLLAYALAGANVLVGVVNLLPGLPLDGGHVLEAVVWRATGRRATGTVVAGYAGYALAAACLVVPLLLAAAGSASVLTLVWGVLVASFVGAGAREAVATGRARARIPTVSVRRLLRPVLAVAADLPVAEAVRRAHEAGSRALVVTAADGSAVGVVQEAAVAALPAERRPWVAVRDVARSLAPGSVLGLDLAGEQLVEAVTRAQRPEYLVLDDEGRLAGVLALADLDRALTG